jgi:hypothetical protein
MSALPKNSVARLNVGFLATESPCFFWDPQDKCRHSLTMKLAFYQTRSAQNNFFSSFDILLLRYVHHMHVYPHMCLCISSVQKHGSAKQTLAAGWPGARVTLLGELGDCSLRAVFLKISETDQIFGLLCSTYVKRRVSILIKFGLGYVSGDFSQTHLVPLPGANPTTASYNFTTPRVA